MSELLVSPVSGAPMRVDDPARAAELKSQGWSTASAAAEEQFATQEQYGGIGGTALATGAGALRGATMGASDVVLGAMGADDELRNLRQVNPLASMVGEVGGSLLGAGKLKAGAAAGQAARGGLGALRAISAPARAVTRAGEAAGALAGRYGGSIARLGAQGALEGAAFGAQQAITEDALGERELTAQGLIASIGYGAALGGGTGSALAVTGKAARYGMQKLASTVDASGGKLLGKVWSGVSGMAGVKNADVIADMADPAFRKMALEGEPIVARATQDLTETVPSMFRKQVDAGDLLKGAMKEAQMAPHMNALAREEATAVSRAQMEKMVANLDEMLEAGRGSYGRRSHVKKLRERLGTLQKKLAGDVPQERVMMIMDEAKRAHARIGMKGMLGKLDRQLTPMELATKKRLVQGYMDSMSLLENKTYWGHAATIQKEVNEAWAGLIQSQGKDVRKLIGTETAAPFTLREVIDQGELKKLVANPNTEAAQQTIAELREFVTKGEKFVEVSRKHLSGTEGLAGYADELTRAKQALNKLDEVGEAQRRFAALSNQGDSGIMAGLAGGAAVQLGAAAAPLGALASVVLSPARAIRQLHAMEQAGARLGERLKGISAKVVGRNLLRGAQRGGITASAWTERERDRSLKAAAAARDLDPATAERDALVRLGALGMGAPGAVAAAGRTVGNGAGYLRMHAPVTTVKTSATVPLQVVPPDDELARWEARRRAVDQPASLMRDIQAGELPRPEAIEAVRTVYPDLYEQHIVQPLLNEVTRATERGHGIDYDTAALVHQVTGVPVSPLDAPEISAVIAQAFAGPDPQQEQAPRRPRPGRIGRAMVKQSQTEVGEILGDEI